MNKMGELDYASEHSAGRIIWGKLNEVIRAVNNLKCVEEEEPIYEVLSPGDCLVISKNEEGLLVACIMGGKMELRRVKYPKEEEDE